jgi:sulfane dehydrogenase subunit SoxC
MRALAESNRRRFLFGAGSGAALILTSGQTLADDKVPAGAKHFDVPDDPTKEQGRPVADDGGYGSRSQFETAVRELYPMPNQNNSWSMTPLAALVGNITPSGLHFERHHGGIPTINPDRHSLVVHGMVGTPKRFSMNDLRKMPSVTRKHFIECSGNGLTEWKKPTMKTVQQTHLPE